MNVLLSTNVRPVGTSARNPVRVRRTPTTMLWYDGGESRRPIVSGNWKLNPLTAGEAKETLKLLAANQRAMEESGKDVPEVILFPPYPFVPLASEVLEGTTVAIGGQDCSLFDKGAYTGEVSVSQLASLGCNHLLVGHSERRTVFNETDAEINKKVHLGLSAGLRVMICIGETEEEFIAGLADAVNEIQVKKALSGVTAAQMEDITIAYEPVWAIGTGKVCDAPTAQEVHAAVRRVLDELYPDTGVAAKVRILYGGSVTPDSIDVIMRESDVDGVLVGGASLVADKFSRIIDFSPPLLVKTPPRVVVAKEVVACRNTLGESPIWDSRAGLLHWVSAMDKEIWTWHVGQSAPVRRTVEQIPGCIGLTEAPGVVVCAMEDSLVKIDLNGKQLRTSVIAATPERGVNTRGNDGRVDRSGRFVFGMYNNYHRGGADVGDTIAGVHRLSGDTVENLEVGGFRATNAICFDASGSKMYLCDTPARKVYQYDYAGSKPAAKKLIYEMPSGLDGGPDGACTDDQGYVWVALSGASQVARVNPQDGSVDLVVKLPVTSPTSCTIGGADLDTLFITTRTAGGGGLYAVKLPFGIRGVPEGIYCSGSSGSMVSPEPVYEVASKGFFE